MYTCVTTHTHTHLSIIPANEYCYNICVPCGQANVAPNTVMASRHKKAQARASKQSKPVYLHSQED